MGVGRKERARESYDGLLRWIFNLEFYTPRYLIARKIRLDKLKIEWGLRARKYEMKIKKMENDRWVKKCWREKEERGWRDIYGKERERYRRNVWGIEARELSEEDGKKLNRDILEREKGVQVQYEGSRIRDITYNVKYKLLERIEGCKYLRKEETIGKKRGERIRALMRVRCGSMEEDNKYWLGREKRICVFCKKKQG